MPRLKSDDPTRVLTVRVRGSLVDEIDNMARSKKTTRALCVEQLLAKAVRDDGGYGAVVSAAERAAGREANTIKVALLQRLSEAVSELLEAAK